MEAKQPGSIDRSATSAVVATASRRMLPALVASGTKQTSTYPEVPTPTKNQPYSEKNQTLIGLTLLVGGWAAIVNPATPYVLVGAAVILGIELWLLRN